MTTTFSSQIPQTAPPVRTDSLRRVERKAAQAALRKKLQADEAEAGVSHSDSAYFYPSGGSFAATCLPASDVEALVSPSAYQTAYLSLASKADSISAVRQSGVSLEQQPALIEPAPRGHAPLRPYAGGAVVSFLIVVLVLAVVRATSRTFIGDLFGFFTGSIGWKRLEGSQFVQKSLNLTLVDGIYTLMLAVVAVEAALVFSPGLLSDVGVYRGVGFAAAAVVAYYLCRFVADVVISYAFRVEERMRAVTICRRAACGVMGILLAPCALVMPFVSADGCKFLTVAACFVIIATSLLCLGKTMRINMTSLPTILYFILYLCIVEAAPLVCLFRLATMACPPELYPVLNQ